MVAITEMVELEMRGDIALVLVDNPPVNALSQGVREGLLKAFERVTGGNELLADVPLVANLDERFHDRGIIDFPSLSGDGFFYCQNQRRSDGSSRQGIFET